MCWDSINTRCYQRELACVSPTDENETVEKLIVPSECECDGSSAVGVGPLCFVCCRICREGRTSVAFAPQVVLVADLVSCPSCCKPRASAAADVAAAGAASAEELQYCIKAHALDFELASEVTQLEDSHRE